MKDTTLGLIFSWIFGVIFLLLGLAVIINGSYISGIIVVLCSAMIIPSFNNIIATRFKFQISRLAKFSLFLIILIFLAIGLSNPSLTDTNSGSNSQKNFSNNISPKAEITPSEPNLQDKPNNSIPKRAEIVAKVPETKNYALGEEIQAGDFKWKVIDFTTTQEIGEEFFDSFFGVKADGVFVIIDVEVENTGDSAKLLSDSFVKLVDEKGREFSSDSAAAFYLKPQGSALFFEQLNPGITKKGKVVFDVPHDLKVISLRISSNMIKDAIYSVKLMY